MSSWRSTSWSGHETNCLCCGTLENEKTWMGSYKDYWKDQDRTVIEICLERERIGYKIITLFTSTNRRFKQDS